MSLTRIIIVSNFIMLSITAWGQTPAVTFDSTSVLSFSGSIDTYYHKSFNRGEQAPRTSFSNLPGFSLGMINLVMEYSGKKSGFTADMVLGPRGTDAVFNAPRYKNLAGGGSAQIINQMFVYYSVSDFVRINVGQFNTFFGYESISPSKNAQYSTSYLFSYGPFNHTGVWADLKLGENCFGKLAVMNPTDFTEFNPFNSYTVGGQLSFRKKRSIANINLSWGDPDGKLQLSDSIGSISAGNALQADFTGSFTISNKYSLGVSTSVRSLNHGQQKNTMADNVVLQRCGYYGLALYQTLVLSPSARMQLRSEYFYEYNNGVNAISAYSQSGNAGVFEITANADLNFSALRVIPEIRFDKTTTGSFTLGSTGASVSTMVSVNIAVVYVLPVITRKIKS